ncbi:hypothetical protein [Aphanothece sacrum]|nr:hypothetical protein [Aphanothece sacrum]GBF84352.1 hypothetical protein AsFPU3_1401 [Aphanothece sacrum FPU3]
MTYTVSIALDNETLTALNNGTWQMQVYKGCKSPNASAALPTVWYTVPKTKFSNEIKTSWHTPYGGYFSNTSVTAGTTVNTSTNQPMSPGDVITLNANGSASVSTSGGVSGAFSFLSQKTETWTCGLLVTPKGGEASPICAFPQYGAAGNLIQPYEKVLILFTQAQLNIGAVVQTSLTKSVSCVLSTSQPKISVAFNINSGWNTMGNPQAKQNPIQFDLAADLIIPLA